MGLARLLFGLWLLAGAAGHFTGWPVPVPGGATPLALQLLDAFRHSGLLDVAMAMQALAGALMLLGVATPFALALAMPLSTCALYWAVVLNQQPGWAGLALVAFALNGVLMLAYLSHYRAMLAPAAMAVGEREGAHYNALFARLPARPLRGTVLIGGGLALAAALAFYQWVVPFANGPTGLVTLLFPLALFAINAMRGLLAK